MGELQMPIPGSSSAGTQRARTCNSTDLICGIVTRPDQTRPDDTLRYVLMIRYTDSYYIFLFPRYQTSTQQLYLLRGIFKYYLGIHFKNT